MYGDLSGPRSALCTFACWPIAGACREYRGHHPPPSGIQLLQVGQDFVLQDFVPDPRSLAKALFFFKNLKPSSPRLPAEYFPKSHAHIYTWKLQPDCEQAPSKEMLHLINETLIAKPWSGSHVCPCWHVTGLDIVPHLISLPVSRASPPALPPQRVGGEDGKGDAHSTG